ncbi:LysR family transcriptional regulator [Saccharothrix variisporea]|uniref:DNA-binding transcriptional LysR family regulator n=1 Tax=Saccharothrix variisporea TaxID=543527 RepID=A0A495X8Y6_9PSEU|nr:LysR family transcriptional regulator [Saccharothrix variisporea]RKT68008.1 DNA-binding transcriptional LysR family regulator [Saccharothrix variisporea]
MELRQLRVFEAVVRHGTVTEAAGALGLAPSSVSEQVRSLERSLGVAVFDRTATGMRPTPAGDRLVGWARRLLEQAEQARREVTRPAVRLGALETIAASQVPLVLGRLAARRPEVVVDVRSSASRTDLMAEVASGRLEAALVLDTGPALGDLGFPTPSDDSPLAFLDVADVPLVLVGAPGHPLAGRAVPADLGGERLLVSLPNCSFRLAADRWLDAAQRVHAGPVPVMKAWAAQGLGVALLPSFAVTDELASGALVRLDFPVPDLSLRLLWREDREDRPGLRDVLYAVSAVA